MTPVPFETLVNTCELETADPDRRQAGAIVGAIRSVPGTPAEKAEFAAVERMIRNPGRNRPGPILGGIATMLRVGGERFVREDENSVASLALYDGALDTLESPRFPKAS